MAGDQPSKLVLMRRFRSMQQSELARRIGVSVSTVSNWERRRVEPDFRDLVNVALVLDCELGDIVDDDLLEFRPRTSGDGDPPPPLPHRRRLRLDVTHWTGWPTPSDVDEIRRVSRVQQDFRRQLDGDAEPPA